MKLRFYEHFACGYGTLWLLFFVIAMITRSHIDLGGFGAVGFPMISLIYAFIRRAQDRRNRDLIQSLQNEIDHLRAERTGMLQAVQEIENSRRLGGA